MVPNRALRRYDRRANMVGPLSDVSRDNSASGGAGDDWARAVLDSIGDGLITIDANWRITCLNARGAELLAPSLPAGVPWRGLDIWQALPGLAESPFGAALREAMASGTAREVEDWYEPLRSWFEVRYRPFAGGLAAHFVDIGPRRRMEAALRDSEARLAARVAELETLYAEAPLGLAMLDCAFRFVRINPALAEMNGHSVEAHLGRSVWDMVPDVRASAEPLLHRVLETGEALRNVEISGETPARPGVVRQWCEHFYPVRNEIGAITGIAIICEEITERQAAQSALAASEALFRATFENAAVGFAQLTPDGRWLRMNQALAAIVGHPRQQILDRRIQDITHPDELARDLTLIRAMMAGETETGRLEKRYRRADGAVVDVDVGVGCVRGDDGRIDYFIATVQDMTERKRAEAALAASEQRFRALADNISQLAWIADSNWEIFWYNQRWYDYTGTDLEAVMGWGWRAVHHPDHVDRVVESVQRAHASGEPWEDTFPLRGVDGSYRWFLSRAQPIRDADGSIALWFGTNTDITEQMEREAQVRLLMREVNHRSKNMLAVVHAVARQTLASGPEDFVDRFSERIRALAAAHDLLVDNDWRGVDLGALVFSQLAHFGDLVGSRIRIEGPPVRLNSAAAQSIGMAIHELATNAGKYGALQGGEGEVRIEWRWDAERLAMLWQERGGPPVHEPSRLGFGSRVIGRMTRLSLGAEVAVDYDPAGLAWRMSAPASRIADTADV